MAPDQPGHEAQHEAERDGQDDDGDLRLARHAPHHDKVERIAESAHDQDRQRRRQQKGQPHELAVGQPEADERAQHHEVALGEIHRLGRLVDEHEAHGDQAIDAAIGEAADDQLQDIHACLSSQRAGGLATVPSVIAFPVAPAPLSGLQRVSSRRFPAGGAFFAPPASFGEAMSSAAAAAAGS
jgi:hypothetical protein